MKLKKIISLLLVMVFVFALASCANSNDTSNESENSEADASAAVSTDTETDDSTDDGTVYKLNYATPDSPDSLRYIYLEEAVVNKIEELSEGRIEITIYTGGSLAGTGSVIQGCWDGICDMGIDIPVFYAGAFPYAELIGTPGVDMGSTFEEKMANQKIYTAEYSGAQYNESLHLLYELPTLDFVLATSSPIESLSDLQAMTISASPNFMGIFTGAGGSVVNVDNADLYESLRLSVVDGFFSGMGILSAFRLFEVTDYAYSVPGINGNMAFVMRKEAYESLPADLQAVIDDVSENYMDAFVLEFLEQNMQAVVDEAAVNTEFKFVDLPDDAVSAINEVTTPMLEAKAAELDEAGLDGAGALELINSLSD